MHSKYGQNKQFSSLPYEVGQASSIGVFLHFSLSENGFELRNQFYSTDRDAAVCKDTGCPIKSDIGKLISHTEYDQVKIKLLIN